MREKEANILLKSVNLGSRVELAEEGNVEHIFAHHLGVPRLGKNAGKHCLARPNAADDLQPHHGTTSSDDRKSASTKE